MSRVGFANFPTAPEPVPLRRQVRSRRMTSRAIRLATASVVVTVPIILIVLLFQRKIVAGLTSGAVKG